MKKLDLIKAIATDSGLSQKVVESTLNSFISVVTAELKADRDVNITGFGVFKITHRKARNGVNPKNPSEKIKIPAMKSPSFKAGKTLKEEVK